ncbi:TonB-dependent receptor plug domain-containing protein [Sphingomonas solaris]|uniref:TonB-dependent receptor n=1 Tax=Alterirhizorhabdus solaris TaxID=2529389 RepID=A0A558R6M7_9SPHN|nr:TonB-dependent receptor [Sphingomonas solaris]TVV74972.1 TonB-dependent receptor [Sphingomonas solaris]
MIKYALPLVLLAATPAFAAADLAEGAPAPDAAATPESDAIVVTAARAPIDRDRIASSITVLDKAAIDRNQDIGVSELLLRTPGISLSRNGGYGTNTSLRIRGAEADQTVVVIDGVKLNDPSSPGGGYNFANLLTADATRIEVLRGPQSILWGSQAIGGVVNIVTPLAERALEGSVDLETGSRETVSGRAALGGRTGPLAWRVGAQAFTTDGISAIAPTANGGGREKDGYTNQTVQGRAVLDLASNVSADVRGYYSHGRTEIDSTTADTRDYSLNREFVGYAGLNVDLFDGKLHNRFGYGYTDTDRDNYSPTRARQLTFDAAGRNERLEYQGNLTLGQRLNAVFGVENERSRFRSVSPPAALTARVPDPARGRAEITGVYGQLNAEIVTGLTLTGGIRHDDHSRFGGRTLFAGGGAWVLPTGTVLRASYAEGFKAPTLYQLSSEFGNQALAPEEAKGWEAGGEQRFMDGALAFGATYFERRTINQIIYNSCAANSALPLCFQPGSTTRRAGYYQNVARAFAQGIEATAQAQVGSRLLIDGNYSWTEAEDRSAGANFGRWLPRRPRHAANASATYTLPGGPSLGVAARWSGHTFDNAANSVRLDDYTLVDVRAELPLSDAVRLFARVENVFDEQYQTAFRYGTLGRSVYAGLRGRF